MQRNDRRLGVLLLLAALLVAVLLSGCGAKAPAETEATLSEAEIWGTAPPETLGIAVENDYMTFYYPQEWENKVEEIRTEENGNVVVTFRTEISGREVDLFAVVMSPDAAEGYLLGHLEEKGNRIGVYTIMYEANAGEWTEEEFREINTLQERVNDIIVQFYEDARFVPEA